MSQAEDIEAINKYITSAKLKTKAATDLHDAWIRWHDGLSWYERTFDGSIFDEARNRRYRFNLANATTKKQVEQVKQQQKTGLTAEEVKGEARRMTSEGTYETPLVSAHTKAKWTALTILGALTFGAGYIAKRVYLDPLLSKQ